MNNNKRGLGRGLQSLFEAFDEEQDEVAQKSPDQKQKVEDGVCQIDISKIYPNPNQPRKHFDQEALNELANSIRVHGVIQPVVLNKNGDNYLIIAGERRYRAAKIAGLQTLPCIIKNYTEKQIKEISIIENLQREDLNPIEAARAIDQLMKEYKLTQEVVAERIGKSRSNIANTLRLLTLQPEVIALVEDNKLSSGHARCLVVVDDRESQIKLANYAAKHKASVRDLEKAVKQHLNPKPAAKTPVSQSIELKDLVTRLQRTLSTKVSIIGNDNKGRIYIDYYNRDDLDRISEIIDLVEKKTLTLKDLQNFNKTAKK